MTVHGSTAGDKIAATSLSSPRPFRCLAAQSHNSSLQATGKLDDHLFAGSALITHEPRRALLLEPPTSQWFPDCCPRNTPRLVPLAPCRARPKPNPVFDCLARYRNPWVPELVHNSIKCCTASSKWATRRRSARTDFTTLSVAPRTEIPRPTVGHIGIPQRLVIGAPCRELFQAFSLPTPSLLCLLVGGDPSSFTPNSANTQIAHRPTLLRMLSSRTVAIVVARDRLLATTTLGFSGKP